MEDYLRFAGLENPVECVLVADVALDVKDTIADAGDLEQIRSGSGSEAEARDFGPEFLEPQDEPAALEAGMAGDENPAAFIGSRSAQGFHTAHGA
jgi:hypothetical protein